MSNGIVAFTSRVVGVSRDARASRRRRARAMKISFDQKSSRAIVARAMPSGEDRDASASAFAATSPSDSFFASSSVTATFDESLLEALDWSAVDYAKDFGADWWTSARKESVGRVIESAVKDSMRERDTEVVTPALVVESLLSRGALRADVRAALRQRAKRVGEDWSLYAEAEDAVVLQLRRALLNGEDIREKALKMPDFSANSIKDWTRADWERAVKVVLASLIGGGALFASGGTAAPALVAAIHALGFGSEAFAAFGGLQLMLGITGASLCGSKMANRLNEELEEFDLIPLRGAHKSYAMHIYVPGFTRDEHDLLHAWGAKDNQYTAVIPEEGDLGVTFERDADGCVVVKSAEDSIAKLHGVVSGSALVAYRSVATRHQPSVVLAELNEPPTLEELQRVPRPLEVRLQLPGKDGDLHAEHVALSEEMKDVLDNHTKEEHVPEAHHVARPSRKHWGNKTGEQLVLNWEPSTLGELGSCMTAWNETCAVNFYLTPAVLAKTALSRVADAVSWPATLLSSAGFIDDPWCLVKLRGKIAGEELARSLLAGEHGHRPVTFVAYSAGAYVVQACLQKLHEAGERGKNIVDRAVFVSAPISTSKETWEPMREVVSGRLVNVHCHTDWILLLMYKFNMLDPMTRLAGLSIVKRVKGVENHNVSNLRHAHLPDEISRVLDEIDLQE